MVRRIWSTGVTRVRATLRCCLAVIREHGRIITEHQMPHTFTETLTLDVGIAGHLTGCTVLWKLDAAAKRFEQITFGTTLTWTGISVVLNLTHVRVDMRRHEVESGE